MILDFVTYLVLLMPKSFALLGLFLCLHIRIKSQFGLL